MPTLESLSDGFKHPYWDMSAVDYNAEPSGTLGLTAAELALLDNEVVMIRSSRRQQERLMTSRISRHDHDFSDRAKQRAIRAGHSLFHQEMRDRYDAPDASEATQPRVNNWVTSNSNGKRARKVKPSRKGLALRRDKEGTLVLMPDFCDCNCPMCGESVDQIASGDQDSATRKPIHSKVEGSRDSPDVLTLTDVPTRLPMYDAMGAEILGAEKLGVEVSCPSEASPQDAEVSCPSEASPPYAEMSCPSEASSQDVRPVVSTADATLLVNTGDGLNQLELSKDQGVAKSLPPLILSSR